MAKAEVVKQINAPADAVFAHIADFSAIKVGGPIESVEYEGEGVGMIRRLGMSGGVVVERLDVHDPATRRFAYAITNDDSPLPFSGYTATVAVDANDDGTSTVTWTGTFDVVGVPEEDGIKVATGIYAGGIKGARIALEPKA